jgi:hypothetical protein
MSRARPLAPRRRHFSRSLQQLRLPASQRAAAPRPALPHAPAPPGQLPPYRPPALIRATPTHGFRTAGLRPALLNSRSAATNAAAHTHSRHTPSLRNSARAKKSPSPLPHKGGSSFHASKEGGRSPLEIEFQSKLNQPGPAIRKHLPKRRASSGIVDPQKLRVVERIEELRAKLHRFRSFADPRLFHERDIPVVDPRSAHGISSKIAVCK